MPITQLQGKLRPPKKNQEEDEEFRLIGKPWILPVKGMKVSLAKNVPRFVLE
jgi:hypothetical protein